MSGIEAPFAPPLAARAGRAPAQRLGQTNAAGGGTRVAATQIAHAARRETGGGRDTTRWPFPAAAQRTVARDAVHGHYRRFEHASADRVGVLLGGTFLGSQMTQRTPRRVGPAVSPRRLRLPDSSRRRCGPGERPIRRLVHDPLVPPARLQPGSRHDVPAQVGCQSRKELGRVSGVSDGRALG